MKNVFFTLILCFISLISNAQITATIKNPIDQKPIPYVNIWVENENIGVTADENGKFTIAAPANSKLVFNALGYDDKTIEASKIDGIVYLIPKVFELKEVIVSSAKKTIENKIGTFKSKDIDLDYGCNDNFPIVVARYFPNDAKSAETPFIKSIMPFCKSDLNDAKFRLRIFEAKESGLPGKELIDENMIVTINKGSSKPIIDLSKYNLIFPEYGLFVGLEFMQIENNKYLYTSTNSKTNEKSQVTSLEPAFELRLYPSEDGEMWILNKEKWDKDNHPYLFIELPKNKKKLLAIELTLTN